MKTKLCLLSKNQFPPNIIHTKYDMFTVILIVWYRAGGESFERATTEIKPDGVLMFTRVTGEEQGSYICTATNSMGSVSASATLLIAGTSQCSHCVHYSLIVICFGVFERWGWGMGGGGGLWK